MLLATGRRGRRAFEKAYIDFFPLNGRHRRARLQPPARFPGPSSRREGKPSDRRSSLSSHRPTASPLVPEGLRNEVQVVGTIFSADQENPYDVLAINAASAALMISGIPFEGPIGAVRMAYTTDGEWAPHPTYQEGGRRDFRTGRRRTGPQRFADADVAIMMVEAGGNEVEFLREVRRRRRRRSLKKCSRPDFEASKLWIRESNQTSSAKLVKNFRRRARGDHADAVPGDRRLPR